jgi:hypothetical protein
LIGQLKEGEMKEQWFVHIPLNKSLSMTVRIACIEAVEVSSDNKEYQLLVVSGESEVIDLLLGLNIGNEFLDITIDGID